MNNVGTPVTSFIGKIFKRMFNPESKPQLTLEYLINEDAIQWAGINPDNNESLYIFTEKIKDIAPSLYQSHIQEIHNLAMQLWEKGFVEVNWLEDDPIIYLSEKSFDREKLQGLTSSERHFISEVKQQLW
jgi:hypothetical protein